MRNGPARALLGRATSLRGKIAAGYLLSFAFLAAFAAVLFANLLAVEDRLDAYAGISRFLDATLEMRRFEKNYFLYGEVEDLDAAAEHAAEAARMVTAGALAGGAGSSRSPAWLRALAGDPGVTRRLGFDRQEAAALLAEYGALLRGARIAPPSEGAGSRIRELGRRITQIAEGLSSAEGENIQALLRSGRRRIVILVVALLVGTFVLARIVRSTALRPLEELEAGMRRIASGERRMLPAREGELGSLNAAFNRMLAEILEHREEVLRAERLASLGTMLAGIAHELNNPLSNISTSAELLDEGDEALAPEERRELVRQVVSEARRATELIRIVLEYGREPRAERRPTNLADAVLEAAVLVRGDLPPHVTVELDVAPDLEVLAHKTELQQAFINLMSNAIDAVREARREAPIAVSARDGGDGQVEITFRDRGAGIPAHVIDRIFDPFFSTKDVGHGTGLGLYLTHQIVERHGGTIRVESAPGEGSTFTIRLPRLARAPETEAVAAAAGGGA